MGGLFEEVGVDIAETCAAGTDFFLHPHQMAEKQFLVFVVLFGRQGFDFFGQRADAFDADEKDRREHMFGVFAYGFADNGGQVCHDFFRRPVVFQGVHHAFCRQYAFGKARTLQIFGSAALYGFKYGVADEVVVAVFAVY